MRPLSRNLTLTSLVLLSTGLGCASHAAYRNDASYAYMREQAPDARDDFYEDRVRESARPAPARPYATTASAYASDARGPVGYGVPAPIDAGVRHVSDFHQPLARYGSWVGHPRYGSVFVPSRAHAGHNFRPYTRGNWQYTEWGWTWSSQLPFGWATDHYGRWFFEPRIGWAWVPGTVWAPAWVSWRSGGGYVGWAPLPPGATHLGHHTVHTDAWIFVGAGSLLAPSIHGVMITGGRYRDCYRSTRPQHDVYYVRGRPYYRGPDPDHVRRHGGRVVYRPIHDMDRDRPTTHPPRDVRISGNRDDDRNDRRDVDRRDERDARAERDRNGSSASRDDRSTAGDRGRDGAANDRARRDANDRGDRSSNTQDGSRTGERGNEHGRTQRGDSTRASTDDGRDRTQAGHTTRDARDAGPERGRNDDENDGRSGDRTSTRDGDDSRSSNTRDDRTARDRNERGTENDREIIRDGADRPNRDRNRSPWPTIESPWRGEDTRSPKTDARGNRDASSDDESETRDGVRARKETLRPDTDEVRSPDENPYDGRRELSRGNPPKMPNATPDSPYRFQTPQRGKVNTTRAPSTESTQRTRTKSTSRDKTPNKRAKTTRKSTAKKGGSSSRSSSRSERR